MEVCSGRRYETHAEIVHNEPTCPLCKALDEIAELESALDAERERGD